jgi:hypothetical protein
MRGIQGLAFLVRVWTVALASDRGKLAQHARIVAMQHEDALDLSHGAAIACIHAGEERFKERVEAQFLFFGFALLVAEGFLRLGALVELEFGDALSGFEHLDQDIGWGAEGLYIRDSGLAGQEVGRAFHGLGERLIGEVNGRRALDREAPLLRRFLRETIGVKAPREVEIHAAELLRGKRVLGREAEHVKVISAREAGFHVWGSA